MSIYRGRYYSASGCKSEIRLGTDALMSWFLGAYRSRSAANLGTYACKRLGSGWSIHAERRAADLGTSPYGGVDSTWGWAMANAFRLNSAELGIQLIILGRRVWSCTQPDAGWRNYGGEYHGHAHVELIPSAADNLTAAKIQKIIHGEKEGEDDMSIDKSDANRVFRADGSIDAPTLTADGKERDIRKNPTWAANSAIRATYNNVARVRADLRVGFAKAAADRAAIRELVTGLTGTVQLTPEQVDQLAIAVATAGDSAAREVLDRLEAAGEALTDTD